MNIFRPASGMEPWLGGWFPTRRNVSGGADDRRESRSGRGKRRRLCRRGDELLAPRLPHPPLACRYETLRQYVGAATDGVMVLLANQPADAPALKGLLQELMLLHYGPRVVVIENPSAEVDDALDSVMSRISERRPWNEGRDLIQSVAALANAGSGLGFFDPRRETLKERIGRRLVLHTPSLRPWRTNSRWPRLTM